jgi:hypothetical protein
MKKISGCDTMAGIPKHTGQQLFPLGIGEVTGSIIYDWIGGNCPLQAEGWIDGLKFYFRARGNRWTLDIGGDPLSHPDWSIEQPYGSEPFAAGWMSEDEAKAFIEYGAAQYRASLKPEGSQVLAP